MSTYIQNFLKFRPLLTELLARDIKIKYRRSVLGVFWTLLNPLCMMIILSIVFSNIFKFDVENFPLYVLSGQVIFNFFSDSTTMAMSSIIHNASLLKKIYVPKYLFVLSRIASATVNLLAAFTALLLVMVAMRVELHYTTVLFFVPLGLVIVFSLGVSLFLSAVTVRFRDIEHLYKVFITGFIYLAPVIYPMSILPDGIALIVRLNPITNYLLMFRDVMLNGCMFSWTSLLIGVLEAGAVLLLGIYVFYKNQDEFILYI